MSDQTLHIKAIKIIIKHFITQQLQQDNLESYKIYWR